MSIVKSLNDERLDIQLAPKLIDGSLKMLFVVDIEKHF